MGARVVRMFRNFNLENRVHKELSKDKPLPAPRHAVQTPASGGSSEAVGADPVDKRNDSLLSHLRTVYVDSTDPPAAAAATAAVAEAPKEEAVGQETARRPLKFSLPPGLYDQVGLTDVPKGKLTIAEALQALGIHKHEPQTWTPEKIAQEYSLDLKDTKALLEFFIPFEVHIIQRKTDDAKQIKDS